MNVIVTHAARDRVETLREAIHVTARLDMKLDRINLQHALVSDQL